MGDDEKTPKTLKRTLSKRRQSVLDAVEEEDILRARSYMMGITLGKGAFSKVKGAYCERRKSRVAIKIINRARVSENYSKKFLPRELQIIPTLDHPNIIKTFEHFEIRKKVCINS